MTTTRTPAQTVKSLETVARLFGLGVRVSCIKDDEDRHVQIIGRDGHALVSVQTWNNDVLVRGGLPIDTREIALFLGEWVRQTAYGTPNARHVLHLIRK